MNERIIAALKKTWNVIAGDVLQAYGGDIGREEVLEACTDFLTAYGKDEEAATVFLSMNLGEMEEIGKEAFPLESYGF
jgi:hypothetical protein